jgi:hypothetical protein
MAALVAPAAPQAPAPPPVHFTVAGGNSTVQKVKETLNGVSDADMPALARKLGAPETCVTLAAAKAHLAGKFRAGSGYITTVPAKALLDQVKAALVNDPNEAERAELAGKLKKLLEDKHKTERDVAACSFAGVCLLATHSRSGALYSLVQLSLL